MKSKKQKGIRVEEEEETEKNEGGGGDGRSFTESVKKKILQTSEVRLSNRRFISSFISCQFACLRCGRSFDFCI